MSLDRLKNFSREDHSTWTTLFKGQDIHRSQQIVDLFSEGLKTLEMNHQGIPDLPSVNRILMKKTGFKGVPVEGLENAYSFFSMLARREFPIGNFIRSAKDLSYTPAPDVFHDLYGHIPFYADQDYADWCQKIGEAAIPFFNDPMRIRQFERLFWFTIEFGLVKTPKGLRIFGAGIASSRGECSYALSGQPEILAFDLDMIRTQEYRIDQMQSRLFVIEDVKQLYGCIDEFVNKVKKPL